LIQSTMSTLRATSSSTGRCSSTAVWNESSDEEEEVEDSISDGA